MVGRRLLLVAGAAAVALAGCSSGPGPTQVVIVTDTDFLVPDEIDTFHAQVMGPDGAFMISQAHFGPGQEPPPRSLALLYQGGRLGPFEVRMTGIGGSVERVERRATFDFVPNRIMMLEMHLLRECAGWMCSADQTCDRGGCRAVDANADLVPWTGSLPGVDGGLPPQRDAGTDAGPPRDGGDVDAGALDAGPTDAGPPPPDAGPMDAGPPDAGPVDAGPLDACVPVELCNGIDDDCDGMVDEGFDLTSDPMNCGMCGTRCSAPDRDCCASVCGRC